MLFLLNTTGSQEDGVLEIFGDDGSPLSITRAGGPPGSAFAYSIPANGVFLFESDGSSAGVKSGWIRLSPAAGHSAPAGAGAFQVFSNGNLVSESGIPSATPTTRARVYIDKTRGHDTGVAIANQGFTTANLTVKSFELDGATPAGSGSAAFQMNALGHRADLARISHRLTGQAHGRPAITSLRLLAVLNGL